MRVAVRSLVLVVALVLGLAAPAAADPPAPTEWRSVVVGLDPSVDGITIEVAGGDGFLDLTVEPGHEVVVYGYPEDDDLEEYLRFSPDGTVERNLRSPATYLNEDRFAQVEPPADLEPGDEPVWEQVATGGRYAWHDHRIHFMGTTRPPGAFEEPTPWEVPIRVDGTEVVVQGTLEFLGSTSPLPWVAVALLVAVALVVLARGDHVAIAAAGLVAGSAAALVVSVATLLAIPPGGGGSAALVRIVVTAAALAAAALAAARSKAPAGAIAGLAAVALLAGWALLRLDVLQHPILPTDLPFTVDRAVTAAAVGAALAGAVVVVRSGALRLPELSDEE